MIDVSHRWKSQCDLKMGLKSWIGFIGLKNECHCGVKNCTLGKVNENEELKKCELGRVLRM